jgi:guanine deaminase
MSAYKEKYMREAIQCASESIDLGGGPFGAVIVKDDQIIAKSSNSVTKDNDPTAHAEVNAIRKATQKLNSFDLSGCEIYTSCEPCPMCLGAIYWAHLDKVYYAGNKTDAKNAGFDDSFIYEELEKIHVERSIPFDQKLQNEAQTVFKKWLDTENKTEY